MKCEHHFPMTSFMRRNEGKLVKNWSSEIWVQGFPSVQYYFQMFKSYKTLKQSLAAKVCMQNNYPSRKLIRMQNKLGLNYEGVPFRKVIKWIINLEWSSCLQAFYDFSRYWNVIKRLPKMFLGKNACHSVYSRNFLC